MPRIIQTLPSQEQQAFLDFLVENSEARARRKAESDASKAAKKKRAIIAGTAVVGGAIGAASAAGSGAAALTSFTGSSTAGIVATGALTGAVTGAQAGQAFAGGDIAGGIGAIAAPFAAPDGVSPLQAALAGPEAVGKSALASSLASAKGKGTRVGGNNFLGSGLHRTELQEATAGLGKDPNNFNDLQDVAGRISMTRARKKQEGEQAPFYSAAVSTFPGLQVGPGEAAQVTVQEVSRNLEALKSDPTISPAEAIASTSAQLSRGNAAVASRTLEKRKNPVQNVFDSTKATNNGHDSIAGPDGVFRPTPGGIADIAEEERKAIFRETGIEVNSEGQYTKLGKFLSGEDVEKLVTESENRALVNAGLPTRDVLRKKGINIYDALAAQRIRSRKKVKKILDDDLRFDEQVKRAKEDPDPAKKKAVLDLEGLSGKDRGMFQDMSARVGAIQQSVDDQSPPADWGRAALEMQQVFRTMKDEYMSRKADLAADRKLREKVTAQLQFMEQVQLFMKSKAGK